MLSAAKHLLLLIYNKGKADPSLRAQDDINRGPFRILLKLSRQSVINHLDSQNGDHRAERVA
jgi:hypothetical protein